jgi:mono/diheme cytochrome c family protein
MRSLILLLIAACGTDIGTPVSDAPPVVEDAYRAICAGCHGPDGDGTASAPQIRSPVHAYASYVIRNGRGAEMGFAGPMPNYAEGDLPDLEPIFAWLDRPPHPTDGPTLYTRYCGNCHGADAHGGRVGEDLTHEAREGVDEVLEKVREGHGGSNYGARTKYMPSWSSAELTDADVAAITSYIASLPPGPGDGDDDD